MSPAEVADLFRRRHGSRPRLFRAPGRVNLIGDHTDYHEGFVLPMALHLGTTVAAAPRADRRVRAWSVQAGEEIAFDLDGPPPPARAHWGGYVEGTARVLDGARPLPGGADLVLDSDVPLGSGLSSSAALEVSVGLALRRVYGQQDAAEDLARAGQEAEHRFVGTQCGIMDQMIAVAAVSGSALLLDCRSLARRTVPLPTETAVAVCDSGIRHALASSGYNERRAETARALAALRTRRPGWTALRDVEAGDLETVRAELPDLLFRRVRHVVTENARTVETAGALAEGDIERAGRLMTASHASLRDDYAVSVPAVDRLVEDALARPGALGARMTGGGFGGSVVALVRRGQAEAFARALRAAAVRLVEPGSGAQEIVLDSV